MGGSKRSSGLLFLCFFDDSRVLSVSWGNPGGE